MLPRHSARLLQHQGLLLLRLLHGCRVRRRRRLLLLVVVVLEAALGEWGVERRWRQVLRHLRRPLPALVQQQRRRALRRRRLHVTQQEHIRHCMLRAVVSAGVCKIQTDSCHVCAACAAFAPHSTTRCACMKTFSRFLAGAPIAWEADGATA